MGKHVAAWFTTFILDMVAVLVLAFLMGDTGAALGMAAGGVALAGVAVVAAVDGAVGGAALLLLVPAGLAAPVGAVTSAEVAVGRPVASVVQGDESASGTTVPLVEPGMNSVVGPDGEPDGSSPCAEAEDAVAAGETGTCPPTVVSVPSEGATEGPDDGTGGGVDVDPDGGTDGGPEEGTDGGTDGGGGTDDTGGTGGGGGTDDGAGGLGGGPSSGAGVP
ncbi:hypothetical protein O4J56_12515 [Nocardiopsis sp. RSe5-2]|uniref:Uncharacterized protein n=1 Tax=Nocardiopsis endophytica TaxID=3018445 RepID=A0ABT4U3C5_9ACTN|nr:hypothetical protein [Nocardiopsis endophytica]MDA2811456.1 hypothetical protein [Nocardiopsis endophytica]